MYGEIKNGYVDERYLNEEALLLYRTLDALYQIENTCAFSTACYKCPFCRYEHDRIMKDHIYEVKELCAIYEVFGKIPRMMETGKLTELFEEGRKGDEILHEEDAEGSEPTGWAETPAAAPDGRSE